MVSQPCQTALVILLGATEFPDVPQFLPSETFDNSCNAIAEYFCDPNAFHLATTDQLLNLFDRSDNAIAILQEIQDWLRSTLQRGNEPITDLIVYYVGHGSVSHNSNEYSLAIRASSQDLLDESSLRIRSLVRAIQASAGRIRKYFIIDACFAGRAGNVQGHNDREARQQIEEVNRDIVNQERLPQDATSQAARSQDIGLQEAVEIHAGSASQSLPEPNRTSPERTPLYGTSFLCATSSQEVAVFGETYTIFSEALLHCLTADGTQLPYLLSLADLNEHTRAFIINRYRKDQRGGLPELHSPDQRDGNIANCSIFPRRSAGDRPAKRILWRLDGKVMVLIETENNESFYIDECPVTREQYEMVSEGRQPEISSNLTSARQKDDGFPKVSVSPQSASEYARRVSKRLPSPEQWRDLIRRDGNRYSPNGRYQRDPSSANLTGRLSRVRQYDPQHVEQIWDLVGNTFEILQGEQEQTGERTFYRVSSFHTSPELEAFPYCPECQSIPATEYLNIQSFRTTIWVRDLSQLDPERRNATFIPLAEG